MTDSKLSERIPLVATKAFRARVDAWRRQQDDLPTRSEAIRRLVELQLDKQDQIKHTGIG